MVQVIGNPARNLEFANLFRLDICPFKLAFKGFIFWNWQIKIGILWSEGHTRNIKTVSTYSQQVPKTRILGMSGPGKILEFEVLKLLEMHWNCQSYHHHVILYHFKSFTIPSGRPFWLLGGACATCASPCPRVHFWFVKLCQNSVIIKMSNLKNEAGCF